MKCPKGFEVPEFPTWMNTIRVKELTTFHSYNVLSLGYLYLLVDNRVYFPFRGPGPTTFETDTGWDYEDVCVNTVQAPELDRFINVGKDSW